MISILGPGTHIMLLFPLILLIVMSLVVNCPTGDAINLDDNWALQRLDDRPMKVLILVEPNPVTYQSGQTLRFMMLLHHLTDQYPSDDVQLITVDQVHPNPPNSTCRDGRVPIHYTSGWRLPQYRTLTVATPGISTTRKVWRICKTTKPDIIHVSSPGFLQVSAIIASRLLRIPLLMSYHTHLPVFVRSYLPSPINRIVEWVAWQVLKVIHSMADLSVVTSPQIATEFASHGIQNVQLWPKGIDTTKFHPRYKCDTMRNRMSNNHPHDLLLVYLGRLAREKRLHDLKVILSTLTNSTTTRHPVRLCIVGDGPEERSLRRLFQDTPTVFLGSLEGESLSQAFASGDVFIMPSDSETLGFVAIESMASGVPVIACRAGGLIDVITDEETGYLVNVGDIDRYVQCIETLMNNATLRDEIVHKARAVTEGWSWFTSMEYLRQVAYPETVRNFKLRHECSSSSTTKATTEV